MRCQDQSGPAPLMVVLAALVLETLQQRRQKFSAVQAPTVEH
tara:strand:- start:386 stop:511 length:126 start_codon:yes stop_codon:yes gene_type:complete